MPFQHFGGVPRNASVHVLAVCARVKIQTIERAVLSPQSLSRAEATVESPDGTTVTATQLASIVWPPNAFEAASLTTSFATVVASSSAGGGAAASIATGAAAGAGGGSALPGAG